MIIEHSSGEIISTDSRKLPTGHSMKGIKTNLILSYIFNRKPHNLKAYDFLKDIYDRRFYHYGDHFKFHFENESSVPFKIKIRTFFYNSIVTALVFIFQKRNRKNRPTVLSTVYFDADLYFKDKYVINVSRPPWAYNNWRSNIYDWALFKKSNYLKKQFKKAGFNTLISDSFIDEVSGYKEELKSFILKNNIVALFLPHDVGFFEKLTIEAFKELNRPAFLFAHGLQVWTNELDFDRGDYLVVWGELSKKDFVENGMNEDKILVSGHPLYRSISQPKLKFELDSVLVLANSLNGIAPSDDYVLTDRSNCIYYLYIIQDCLKKLGVKSVRLRPHPSENPKWYADNIDQDFFRIDTDPLSDSLSKASLVIGPTSTVFLEALLAGVNYLIFNPENQFGNGLNGLKIPSFYNGNHPKVPVAKTTSELENIITSKKSVDISILGELMADEFSLECVYKKINVHKQQFKPV